MITTTEQLSFVFMNRANGQVWDTVDTAFETPPADATTEWPSANLSATTYNSTTRLYDLTVPSAVEAVDWIALGYNVSVAPRVGDVADWTEFKKQRTDAEIVSVLTASGINNIAYLVTQQLESSAQLTVSYAAMGIPTSIGLIEVN